MRHPADVYIGIPFAAHGNTHQGVSCWGLVQLYYREQLGIALPDYPYGPDDHKHIARAIDEGLQAGCWHETDKPQDGDLVIMSRMKYPFHIGVCAAGMILHAEREGQSVVAETQQALAMKGLGRIRFYRHE